MFNRQAFTELDDPVAFFAALANPLVILDEEQRMPGQALWAVEIKRSSAPVLSKGFHLGCADVAATRRLAVSSANAVFPMAGGVEHVPLLDLMRQLL